MKAVKDAKILIEIRSLCPCPSISFNEIKTIIRKILKEEKINSAQLSLLLAGGPFIRRLNRQFLSKDSSTDCLAFDFKDGRSRRNTVRGDIVVNVERASALSKDLKIPVRQEVCRYIIHGLLHLAGYDDIHQGQREKMWKRQEGYLKKVMR